MSPKKFTFSEEDIAKSDRKPDYEITPMVIQKLELSFDHTKSKDYLTPAQILKGYQNAFNEEVREMTESFSRLASEEEIKTVTPETLLATLQQAFKKIKKSSDQAAMQETILSRLPQSSLDSAEGIISMFMHQVFELHNQILHKAFKYVKGNDLQQGFEQQFFPKKPGLFETKSEDIVKMFNAKIEGLLDGSLFIAETRRSPIDRNHLIKLLEHVFKEMANAEKTIMQEQKHNHTDMQNVAAQARAIIEKSLSTTITTEEQVARNFIDNALDVYMKTLAKYKIRSDELQSGFEKAFVIKSPSFRPLDET